MRTSHALALTTALLGLPTLSAQELGEPWGTAEAESRYYRVVEIGLPGFPELEAGSMCTFLDILEWLMRWLQLEL